VVFLQQLGPQQVV